MLQKLNFIRLQLKEAKLTMTLNQRVLQGQREHYHACFESGEFPAEIKTYCEVDLYTFQERIKYLESLLKNECSRVDVLIQLVEGGIRMVSPS